MGSNREQLASAASPKERRITPELVQIFKKYMEKRVRVIKYRMEVMTEELTLLANHEEFLDDPATFCHETVRLIIERVVNMEVIHPLLPLPRSLKDVVWETDDDETGEGPNDYGDDTNGCGEASGNEAMASEVGNCGGGPGQGDLDGAPIVDGNAE